MGSLSSRTQGNKNLPSMIDIFTKDAWVKSLNNNKKLKQFLMVLLKY